MRGPEIYQFNPEIAQPAESKLFRKEVNVTPRERPEKVEAYVNPENYQFLVSQFDKRFNDYIGSHRHRPQIETFAELMLADSHQIEPKNGIERALLHTYGRMGEVAHVMRSLQQAKGELSRLNAGMLSGRTGGHDQDYVNKLQEHRRNLLPTFVTWQQQFTKLVQRLDMFGDSRNLLKQLWADWDRLANLTIEPTEAKGMHTNVLGSIALSHALDKINVDTYLPPPKIDAFNKIDLLGRPRENPDQVMFLQLKSQGAGYEFTVNKEKFPQEAHDASKEKAQYLNSCSWYAKLWGFSEYSPQWLDISGVASGDVDQLSGYVEPSDELLAKMSHQLLEEDVRRITPDHGYPIAA